MESFFQEHIQKLKELGRYRTLKVAQDDAIDFYSNDYLGLAQMNFRSDAMASGSTGSRLISGNSAVIEDFESYIAQSFDFASALTFPSGYQANIGLFSAIGRKHITFIYDEYIHASIIDGMRLSFADRKKFKHNDLDDLERLLQKIEGPKIIVIEGRYSMDGDLSPLSEILKLKQQYGFEIIVDEAHSLGTIQTDYRGLVASLNAQNDILATVYTFGKSVGQHGALICGSTHLREFLINEARSFIFSTGVAPKEAKELEMRMRHMEAHFPQLHLTLEQIITYFTEKSKELLYFNPDVSSPIQFYICGSNEKALQLSALLEKENINCKAIRYPTVPKGKEGVRIVLHSYNTRSEIDLLIQNLASYEKVFY